MRNLLEQTRKQAGEDAQFAAVFASKLLIAEAIFAILDQIWAGAPWTCVGDSIDDHASSIAESASASHYRDRSKAGRNVVKWL